MKLYKKEYPGGRGYYFTDFTSSGGQYFGFDVYYNGSELYWQYNRNLDDTIGYSSTGGSISFSI